MRLSCRKRAPLRHSPSFCASCYHGCFQVVYFFCMMYHQIPKPRHQKGHNTLEEDGTVSDSLLWETMQAQPRRGIAIHFIGCLYMSVSQ